MKILLIGVNNSGLVLPIVEEMRRQGHEVCYLENGEISCYEYLYPAERLLNSLAKGVLGRNLKRERRWLATTQFLNGFLKGRQFDLTILTNPDIYTAEHLAHAQALFRKAGLPSVGQRRTHAGQSALHRAV